MEVCNMESMSSSINNTIEEDTIVRKSFAYYLVKRTFDFLSSLILGIVILIPVMIISIIIPIKDFGSPFYRQKRVGKGGKPLYIYKFRSMRNGSDNLLSSLSPEQLEIYKREYKLDDDPRLIGYQKTGDGFRCFGAILRNTSLDELPQILINICILGNMSVVGPRPILDSELRENYTPEEKRLLLSAKPGLTGYWQAYARNDVGYENHGRQDMELYYVKNQSVWLDIKILFKTVEAVLTKRGAK